METAFIVIGILVALFATLLIYASFKPDAFRIERSTNIKAPPERIFALLADFHEWKAWSPWEKMDPQLKRTFSGSPNGVGAVYEWLGNNKVGQGRMEILEAVASSKIVIKLDFLKPFEAHNTAEFTLMVQGDSTHVTWAMHGKQPFMLKVMCTFMSMDKMVGKDFEMGLANMKAIAEK